MKKCPKCGTILDDSKKTCYMCGTNLTKSNFSHFGDTFDSQIGSALSESQSSILENDPEINQFEEKERNKDNNSFSFINDSATDFFSNDLSQLNKNASPKRTKAKKEETDLQKKKEEKEKQEKKQQKLEEQKEKKRLQEEKIRQKKVENFIKKKEEKEKIRQEKEERAKKLEEEKKRKQEEINKKRQEEKERQEEQKKALLIQEQSKKEEQALEEGNKESQNNSKPKINWGDFLNRTKEKTNYKKNNINHFALFFNLGCILLFIGILLFGYFHFLKPRHNGDSSLGGLHYKVPTSFKLKNEDSGSRYYTYGENCALRITYGPTNDTDSYITNYLNGIKEQYENDPNAISQFEEMKLNDNVWSGLTIMNLLEDESSSTGYQNVIRYKYVSIVYKGNFYHTVYVNPSNDKVCATGYNEFIGSLLFE